MFTAILNDHYDGDWEEEFSSLDDAINKLETVRDDGGDGYVLDEDGNEYDF